MPISAAFIASASQLAPQLGDEMKPLPSDEVSVRISSPRSP